MNNFEIQQLKLKMKYKSKRSVLKLKIERLQLKYKENKKELESICARKLDWLHHIESQDDIIHFLPK
jgi:hypothetical protein